MSREPNRILKKNGTCAEMSKPRGVGHCLSVKSPINAPQERGWGGVGHYIDRRIISECSVADVPERWLALPVLNCNNGNVRPNIIERF